MTNYLIATIGAVAAMNSAQEIRIAEQIVLSSAVQDDDTLEFRLSSEGIGLREITNQEIIHTPEYHTAVSRSEGPQYRVPRVLNKGNPSTLSHPGREYAMRMHGKDNRL